MHFPISAVLLLGNEMEKIDLSIFDDIVILRELFITMSNKTQFINATTGPNVLRVVVDHREIDRSEHAAVKDRLLGYFPNLVTARINGDTFSFFEDKSMETHLVSSKNQWRPV